jgi:crossover junction endodeoxyribonuclease RuvC
LSIIPDLWLSKTSLVFLEALIPKKQRSFTDKTLDTIQVMLILGIDPGLNTTGYGLVRALANRCTLIEAGVIRTPSSKEESDLGLRLKILHDGITDIVKQYSPDAMAIEQLYSHYSHPRTAIIMGHARGVLLLSAGSHSVPVQHYSATRIKKTITGHGRADKLSVQATIMRELNLLKPPEPFDVTDALAAALCHYFAQKMALLIPRKRAV